MQNLTINGRYRILQQIGVGGFGLTYLAEDLHLPTRPKCVVKHLKPQINDAETMQLANRLFQQEAEILYRLGGHPNIPSLIAHFRENGEFYLVQEYIEGQTISQEFASGRRYSQKEMIQLVGQTLEILSFVHKQNVIHRDIKPANLIRRHSDGSIFLIDFGAVKQVNAFPNNSQNSTFSTLTIGSHGYMPTEQMAGRPNFSSDLYALGLVAIESLTGIKPLELKQNNNTGEHIWTHKAQVSPEVTHFISKLVRYDFRQRFISATEALSSLNVIANRVGFFPPKNSLQIVPVAPQNRIVPNNHIVSTITLTPLGNVASAPTLVPAAQNIPDNLIPPTVIVPTQNQPSFQTPQNFQQPPRIAVNIPPSPQIPERNSAGSKAVILIAVFLLFAVGLIFAARSVVQNIQLESTKNDQISNPRSSELPNKDTITKISQNSSALFDEASSQAAEAERMEKAATTKYEWQSISNKYKRAYQLLTTIDSNNSDYGKAQEKIAIYRQKAEYADKMSLMVINNSSSDNSSNYPSRQTTPTPYPTTTPVKPRIVNLTMPPKQTVQSYIAYNYFDGYETLQKVYTSDDSLFTSKLQSYSYNDKDSKMIDIEVEGGNRLTLKFKPPSYTAKLSAGNYASVREVKYETSMNYGISFSPISCYENANHSFKINSIVYNELYQNVSFLDATFVLSCGNRKLMGRIRYDAR
jgi:serine/threonine protein kinase